MTLYDIVTNLLSAAQMQPNINYVGQGDIYSLNNKPNIDYSVFFLTQNNHTEDEDNINYSFNLFYIDRLISIDDNENRLKIQSDGMIVLRNIINFFNNFYDDVNISTPFTFFPFDQKFSDICAGVYVTLTISVPNKIGICDAN